MEPVIWHRYFKRCADEHSEPRVVFRIVGGSSCRLQMWWAGEWVDASDYWNRLHSETDFWEITESEALGSLAALAERHREQDASTGAGPAEWQTEDADARWIEEMRFSGVGLDRDDVMPLSTLSTAAIGLHEMFLSLSQAGFTEKQALGIIVGVITEVADRNDSGS